METSKLRATEPTRLDLPIASASKAQQMHRTLIAFLEALLRSEDGVATIDDATSPTDLRRAFADGGQWRGAITRSLAAKRIIKSIAAGPSKRPSRHSGLRHVWQLVDRAKALKLHRQLTAGRYRST
jgi:hypothetical protein